MGKIVSLKKNIIYNIIKTCSSILFPLITFPYISRVLLPNNVGKYNFCSTFVNYFALIASLGVTTYAIRECSRVRQDNNELRNVSNQIFSINICTTAIAYILLFISLIVFKPLKDYKLLIIILSSAIIFTTLGADWLNSAMEDFRFITLRTFFFQLISLIAMFLFVKTSDDYLVYALITVVSSSGANFVNIWYRKRYCRISVTFNINWKRHFKPIILLFSMQLSQIIFSNCDIIMIGLMRGNYEVGLYSTAIKICNITNQVVASILWVVMPRLSFYFSEKDYIEINKLLRRVLEFTFALGLPCITGIIVLAKDIVVIVGGINYLDAVPVLRILMIALFFSLIGGGFIGNIIMLPSGREKIYLIACSITATFNVITNAIFIPQFGIFAAAMTTALSAFLIWAFLRPRIEAEINVGEIRSLILAPAVGCIFIVIISLICFYIFDKLWIRFIITVIASVITYALVLVSLEYKLAVDILKPILNKLK